MVNDINDNNKQEIQKNMKRNINKINENFNFNLCKNRTYKNININITKNRTNKNIRPIMVCKML